VEWSYSLLNGAEQSLLGRLSVFAESFDLDAAEVVCGFGDIELFDVTDLLGSLVDKSLVVAEPAGPALRYRLLETIRQFAAEKLAEAGHDQAAAVSVGDTRCATGVGPSFVDLVVLKGNLRPSFIYTGSWTRPISGVPDDCCEHCCQAAGRGPTHMDRLWNIGPAHDR
jgi:hypothetical protein